MALLFEQLGAWQSAGLDIKAQVAPRPIGVLLGLDATMNPFMRCASYREIAELYAPERARALSEPHRRRRILSEHSTLLAGMRPGLARDIAGAFDRMFILDDPVDYDFDSADAIGTKAVRAEQNPAAAVFDALLRNEGSQLLYFPLANFVHGNLDDVHAMITSPFAMFGLSDAGAHCGTVCDASSTTSYLTVWGRDRPRDASPSIADVVHQLTQRTAFHAGWLDLGVVAAGYLADLNVIDLDELACRPPRIVRDLPAGGRRLVQDAEGYRWTLKSGVPTFENGTHTDELPGGLVRGARSAPRGRAVVG